MGGGNNLSSCLELLEDQGFKAEHQLFVKMISCMNAYWNTDTFGPDQNTLDPSLTSLKMYIMICLIYTNWIILGLKGL